MIVKEWKWRKLHKWKNWWYLFGGKTQIETVGAYYMSSLPNLRLQLK